MLCDGLNEYISFIKHYVAQMATILWVLSSRVRQNKGNKQKTKKKEICYLIDLFNLQNAAKCNCFSFNRTKYDSLSIRMTYDMIECSNVQNIADFLLSFLQKMWHTRSMCRINYYYQVLFAISNRLRIHSQSERNIWHRKYCHIHHSILLNSCILYILPFIHSPSSECCRMKNERTTDR